MLFSVLLKLWAVNTRGIFGQGTSNRGFRLFCIVVEVPFSFPFSWEGYSWLQMGFHVRLNHNAGTAVSSDTDALLPYCISILGLTLIWIFWRYRRLIDWKEAARECTL